MHLIFGRQKIKRKIFPELWLTACSHSLVLDQLNDFVRHKYSVNPLTDAKELVTSFGCPAKNYCQCLSSCKSVKIRFYSCCLLGQR